MDETSYTALRTGLEPSCKPQTLWQRLILQRAPKDVVRGLMKPSQTFCVFFWLPYLCNMSSQIFVCLACILGLAMQFLTITMDSGQVPSWDLWSTQNSLKVYLRHETTKTNLGDSQTSAFTSQTLLPTTRSLTRGHGGALGCLSLFRYLPCSLLVLQTLFRSIKDLPKNHKR